MRSVALLVACLCWCQGPWAFAQRLQDPRQLYTIDHDEEDADEPLPDEPDDYDVNITREKGSYLGAVCEFSCSSKLLHVICDPETNTCECEKKYPVKLSPTTGCGKPKKLGEQCFYRQACMYADQHSSCIQVQHNAICQCKSGYHPVSLLKPTKRIFCAEDLEELTTDLSTLAGVACGIAIFSGLICFVCHLFTSSRPGQQHRFGDANLAPPILFSGSSGGRFAVLPLSMAGGSVGAGRIGSSRTSSRTLVSSRRPSSVQTGRGIPVSASRAGAARAAAILLISCHSSTTGSPAHGPTEQSMEPESPLTGSRDGFLNVGSRRASLASVHSASSLRSYGGRRLDREREQKEERELQLRLSAKNNGLTSSKPPTPSPLSTDELLPSVEEDKEVPLALEEECPSGTMHLDAPGPSSAKE